MLWRMLRPCWLLFIEVAQKECAGCCAKAVCFVSHVALVCNGLNLWFHELHVVLENSPAVVSHLPEYINGDVDLGRREKAEGLLETLLHPLLKLTAGLFCDVFAVVCATNKKVQATKGAQIAELRGLMNTMCT